MIKIYKTNSKLNKTKRLKNITRDCWIDLVSPSEKEIDEVIEKTKIDKDLIMKMADLEELPRTEKSGNATLIVIDTPSLEDGMYTTYPLGIIITDSNYIITISPKKLFILNDFFNNV